MPLLRLGSTAGGDERPSIRGYLAENKGHICDGEGVVKTSLGTSAQE